MLCEWTHIRICSVESDWFWEMIMCVFNTFFRLFTDHMYVVYTIFHCLFWKLEVWQENFVARGRVYIGKMYPQLCKFSIPTVCRDATEITEDVRIKSTSVS